MMKLINLTPHSISLVKDGDILITLPASGTIARVEEVRTDMEPLFVADADDDIPVSTVTYGKVEGLPEPVEDTGYVVSFMVREAVGARRPDVFSPGPLVRDDAGNIIGCLGLTTSDSIPVEHRVLQFLEDVGLKSLISHDPCDIRLQFDGPYGAGTISVDRTTWHGRGRYYYVEDGRVHSSYPTGMEHEND